MKRLAIETIVPALVGLGLVGYCAFRVMRGAVRLARWRLREFG